MNLRFLATLLALDTEKNVERSAPGKAPTAFRVYAAGENQSDDGPVYFTRESAALLMAEQEARGRLYSIDFDHLSLQSDRPAEAGRASGWARLEVRPGEGGAPELWAVGVDWCADVKAGLEESPPRWRYFSPAFKTRIRDGKDTGEIVSFINIALCINPKTHELPALAAVTSTIKAAAETKGGPMDPEKVKAILASVLAELGDGEKKEALTYAYKAAFPDKPEKGDGEEKEEAVEETSPEKDDDAEKKAAKKAAAEEENPSKDDDAEKKASAKRDADMKLAARVEELERDALRREIEARPDVAGPVKEWLQSQTLDVVRSYLKKAPKTMAPLKDKPTQGKDDGHGAPLLEGREREEMDRAMGMHAHAVRMPERKEDGTFIVHTVRPGDLREAIQKGKV